ncbi:ABC transporter ATP-binding protein [Tomitella biformata]|uniref:ABC transporter ATP-binding protein n=1 Tax=Tomitella biformata TaxID=630403 RepID=UPI00056DC9A9|nr:ABC transporter ATP-binding protein [Tomitella biformata]
MSAGVAVVVRGLGKSYGDVRALDDASFAVEEGVICGVLGRNGAGKTTALQLITGQALPSEGSVEVFGRRPFEDSHAMRMLCFIREGQCYPENFTVAMVLAAAADLLPHWDAEFADRLLERFNLPRKRRVKKLSRGMTSAVGIVLGLASRAPLTLFDEPYLGLDAVARQIFYDELLADYAERPRTVILSTHLIDEVSDLLEQVVLIDQGRVLLDDTTERLRQRAIVATGPASAVDLLSAGRNLFSRESMGAQARAAIEGAWAPRDLAAARAMGVEVEQASLQQLVVGVTRGTSVEGN